MYLVNFRFLVWITCHMSPVSHKTLKYGRQAEIFDATSAPTPACDAPVCEPKQPKPDRCYHCRRPLVYKSGMAMHARVSNAYRPNHFLIWTSISVLSHCTQLPFWLCLMSSLRAPPTLELDRQINNFGYRVKRCLLIFWTRSKLIICLV